ncbi:hypothetical protein P152DRAFT_452604 [Eremomyces bilateralis CBS 781.70]|uniref:O-acyltransferase n=1 Tax=Eremomyces bilateralis CBS 781.70 TaxID=1392243 RepID=A0A6G1FSR9_9PEZI|nr:uncharacterized protein P152DRAFT_452604 [Eremomyces bilateralis CBS 781.70]KAF1808803.1 hypothetical protein P152DRAFT_452604 [Eremomyces bilateralis CBS 781.70]
MATVTGTSTAYSTDMDSASGSNIIHRRAKSPNGTVNEAGKKSINRRTQRYKHVFPVHASSRTSCLSPGAENPPNFFGFRNLMVLMLIVSNLRLILENFRKYGVLVCLTCSEYRRQDISYGLILWLSVPIHLFIALLIELVAAQNALGVLKRKSNGNGGTKQAEQIRRRFRWTWYYIAWAHGINATLNLVVTSTIVYYRIHSPGIGMLCELHAIIVWLKACSYAFTNRDLRHAMLTTAPPDSIPELYRDSTYPNNITLQNLTYFWWAPTLVYQPVYPRTTHIRWLFVAKRVAEALGLVIVIWFASAQYAAPLLKNSLEKVFTLDIISIFERVMKLSTISLFCWLAGFYAGFQSALNALAEVMRFGDREFYSDWWNVTSIRTYWTSWNKPVYQFMKRHIYSPLVGRGVPPSVAQLLVFIFSGILHELLVGIPTHNIIDNPTGVAFFGMMGQIPLILLTDPLQKMEGRAPKVAGNVIFWISFCLIGQPLAAILYFSAWQAKYGGQAKLL